MTEHDQEGFMFTGGAGNAPEPTAIGADAWEDETGKQGAKKGDEALYLELDGWEGPLDLLLDLGELLSLLGGKHDGVHDPRVGGVHGGNVEEPDGLPHVRLGDVQLQLHLGQ